MQPKQAQVTLEKVNVQNFSQFLSLIEMLADYERLAPPDQQAKARLRRDCLSDKPKYQAYIAMLNGKPAGYIIYFYTYSSFLALPTLFIEDIFVREEYRRSGVGKKMFDFLKEVAKCEGCGRIEFTVLKWNRLAQDFYAKNGAKCLSDWEIYRVVRQDF